MLCRYLWLFSLQLGVAFSVREILLDFRTTSSNGGAFLPTDVVILDKDGDGVKPAVEDLSNNILLRINTMPGFTDPNATNLKEDNYIFLPYISNPTGNSMVRLEFTFSHVASCPTYSHASPVQCKNSITMALVSTTPTEVVANIDVPGSALFTKVLTDGTDKVENLHINFPSSTTGYRLVIHDEGSSYLFKHLTISSYHCEYITGRYTLPITCPNTPASNNASPIVQCSCANNSSPTDGKSFIAEKCVYNTAAETADFTRAASSAGVSCSCDPGFTLTGTAPRSCAEVTTMSPPARPSSTSSKGGLGSSHSSSTGTTTHDILVVTTTTASPLTSGSSGSSSGGGGSTPVPPTKKTSSANTPTTTTECSHASHVACSWVLLMLAMTVVLQW